MAYKGWHVCDVCGLEVNRDDKESLKSWMDITIHDHAYWNSDDDPELDMDVCNKACAIRAVKDWLDKQDID